MVKAIIITVSLRELDCFPETIQMIVCNPHTTRCIPYTWELIAPLVAIGDIFVRPTFVLNFSKSLNN